MPEPAFDISRVLEESIARYSGNERLLLGKTSRLKIGERRRIAVLFADLAGFTNLSESIDHEIVHSLISRIMGFLSSVVDSFGGYVDKFEGDRLMALFGAKASAENDSARAVSCALRILDIIEEIGPVIPGNDNLTVRIGIDFGSVTVAPDPTGHLTATGATVNLASRCEEMAQAGRMLVTKIVRQECGGLFRFKEHGEVKVRGIRTPVELFTPLGPGSIQKERWQRARRLSDSPMVNRRVELNDLLSLLQESSSGSRNPVMVKISGEAGIGKSRLLHEFLHNAAETQILHGHARPYNQTPFWIWTGVFREYLGIVNESAEDVHNKLMTFADDCGDTALEAKLKQTSGIVTDILSRQNPDKSGDETEGSRSKAVALRLMLDAINCRGSMIVALEDMHWIDEASLKVLRLYLESGRFFNPVMVAVTERSAESKYGYSEAQWNVIDLEPLSNEEISSITGFILSDEQDNRPMENELEELITRGARGNPFYAEELILGLIDSGGVKSDKNMPWCLTLESDHVEIPSSVQSLIQTRIDKLPREERKVLQLTAVIGDSFRIPVLELVASNLGMAVDMMAKMEILIEKGYLKRNLNGEISFRHDLMQRSVYSTLLKHNRRIIHRVTAEAVENLYPYETDVLAPVMYNHWRAADDPEKMLEWAVKALDVAGANDQNAETMRFADIILDLTADSRSEDKWMSRIRSLQAKQRILARSGMVSEALELCNAMLREAEDRRNSGVEAAVLRLKCILLQDSGDMVDVEDMFRLALKKADFVEDEKLKGKIYGSLANYMSDTGRNEEALEYYEKALAIHEKHGAMNHISSNCSNIGNLLSRIGEQDKAKEHFIRSISINRQIGSRSGLGYAVNGYAICMARDGDLKRAEELFEEALECQIDIGNKTLQSSILNNLGVLTKMRNEYERSLDYREKALKLARESRNKRSECIALMNLGNMYRLMGYSADAVKFCRESRELAVKINDPITRCHSLSVESMAELDSGNIESALKLFEEASMLVDKNSIVPGMNEDYDELVEKLHSGNLLKKLPAEWRNDTAD